MDQSNINDTNSSTYAIPGALQDVTLNSTPMPQASSTAMKRGSFYSLTPELESCVKESEEIDKGIRARIARYEAEARERNARKETKNKETSTLQKATDNLTEMQEKAIKTLEELKMSKEKRKLSSNYAPTFCGSEKLSSWSTKSDLQYDNDEAITKFLQSGNKKENAKEEFEFLVPQCPVKKPDKETQSFPESLTSKKLKSALERPNTGTPLKMRMSEIPSRIYSQEIPEKLSNSLSEADVFRSMFYTNDRASIYSSADSSLGILSPETLEGARELDEMVKLDLSQRLADELQLDTSKIRGLHISDLASSHLSRKGRESRENKENQLSPARKSSDYFTSYSSSDSSSRLTAKEVSPRNSLTLDASDIMQTDLQLQAPQTKPLTERNSRNSRESFPRKSTFSVGNSDSNNPFSLQFGDNPFGDFSRVSMSGEEFASGADAAEKLRKDEEAFSDSKRSLSGIYADPDFSFSTHGHKQSISSFLRSGSGPLGSLEKTPGTESPSFGLPAHSPEKKHRSRPILPPPEDKLTFCLAEQAQAAPNTSEVAPWNLEALLQQYSEVHQGNSEDESEAGTDISVPSLSYIGGLLAEMEKKNMPYVDVLDKLNKASSKSHKLKESHKNKQRDSSVITLDDSALSNCSTSSRLKSIPKVVSGANICRGYESDRSARYSSSFNSCNSINDEVEPISYKSSRMALEDHLNFTTQKSRDITEGARQVEGNMTPLSSQRSKAKDSSVIVIHDSVSESICDVTDFEGDKEECVSVMIPESMDFDIFNDFDTPQQYCVSKACYVEGRRQDNAALIYLPVTELILQPGEQQVVNVTVAALVGKTIKIKLSVTRTDLVTKEKATDNVYGKIVAEYPKIDLVGPATINMKPVLASLDSDFCKEYKSTIELKNIGHSTVPLKLTLAAFADTTYAGMFYFDPERRQSVTLTVGPGQSVKQAVFCQTPPVFELSQPSGIIPVATRVDVFLDTPAQAQLPPITACSCHARLASNFFSAPSSLMVSAGTLANCRLYNSGATPATVRASATADYSVQPSACVIQPHQAVTLTVAYTGGPDKRGFLTLLAMEQQSKFNISLHGTSIPSSQSASNYATPVQSRASSPSSPCSSVGSVGPEGALLLKCTHTELVWGACALQRRVVKSCSIKNQNMSREKLQLTVTDQNNCFKLVNEKNELEGSTKLSLQPMDNRQISVAMIPGCAGPQHGILTISRLQCPSDKKVLPLYGFGGKASVSFDGPTEDPEQRMWLYLHSETLSTNFRLTNDGDSTAFVRITEGRSAPSVGGGLSLVPPESILSPRHSADIEVTLSITPERLEYLLAQPSHSGICVTQLIIAYGDESTRQRLAKLSTTNPRLADKLPWLSQTVPLNLHMLDDPQSCAETLFLDDIHERNIWVMIKRSALQALSLDTTVKYQDLASTIYEVKQPT